MSRTGGSEERLRALGRTLEGRSAPRVANEEGLAALGEQVRAANRHGRHGRPARPRRFRRTKWVVGILGLVIVILVAAVAGYGWYLNHKIHRIAVKDLTTSKSAGAEANTENILLVGSTSRCALAVQNPAYGLCSQGVNGVNSDVIMILHLNPAKKVVSILSIPRDLFVPNARKEGANKVDAALYEGPNQLVDAVQEDFGIPIQHYVELNFDSFANVVNALGGISMYFPEPVYDAYSGLNIQATGCVHLNGTQALQVVRARHLQYKPPTLSTNDVADWPYDPQSDLARIRRDHEFLRVLATAVAKKGIDNPITDEQLVSSVVGQLVVDQGFSASSMVSLVLTYHAVNVNQAPQLTLPVVEDDIGTYYFKGASYGDVEFTAQPQDQQVIDQFLGVSAGTDTIGGGTLPTPGSVTVAVQNGTGAYNQATDTGQALRALGFDVVSEGDTTSVGQVSETVVAYNGAVKGAEAAAQSVVDSMSGAVVLADQPSLVTAGSTVTVVTGSSFSVNSPTTAPTPTTALPKKSKATTTTTTVPATTTTVAQGFTPPTAATQTLQPWDPRSCTPSGGEGT